MKKYFRVAAIIGFIVALTGCGKASKGILLNDYLTYEFKGYNGEGKIFEYLDEDALVEKYGDDSWEALGMLFDISECVGDWEPDWENLSNGDVITFKWNDEAIKAFNDKHKMKVSGKEIKVTVEGLEEKAELEQKDPFEGISISVSGVSGQGRLSVKSDKYPGLSFKCTQTENLKNGDKITIFIDSEKPEEYVADKCGFLPSQKSMKYEVSGLDGYIIDAADIPSDFKEGMSEIIDKLTKKRVDDSSLIKSENHEELGYLVTVYNDESVNDSSVYALYKSDLKVEKSKKSYDVTTYMYVRYDNVLLHGDGTCDVDLSSYHKPESMLGTGTCFETAVGSVTGYETYEDMIEDITSDENHVVDYTTSTDRGSDIANAGLESDSGEEWTFVVVQGIENGIVTCWLPEYVTVDVEDYSIGTKLVDSRGTEYTIKDFSTMTDQWWDMDVNDVKETIKERNWSAHEDIVLEVEDTFYGVPYYEYYMLGDEVEEGTFRIVDPYRYFIPSADFKTDDVEYQMDDDAYISVYFRNPEGDHSIKDGFSVKELNDIYKHQKERKDAYEMNDYIDINLAHLLLKDGKIVKFIAVEDD